MIRWIGMAVSLVVTSQFSMADCYVPIEKSLMALKTVDDQQRYVVSKEYVDQSECLDLVQISVDLKRIKKLEAIITEYKALTDSIDANVQGYQNVNTQLNLTLDRSITLTNKYDQQLMQYDKLSGEFNTLAKQYDKLVEKYRNIALNKSSFMSMDIGVGLDENSDFLGLIGVGFKSVRVWGLLNKENSGVIVGGSVPF